MLSKSQIATLVLICLQGVNSACNIKKERRSGGGGGEELGDFGTKFDVNSVEDPKKPGVAKSEGLALLSGPTTAAICSAALGRARLSYENVGSWNPATGNLTTIASVAGNATYVHNSQFPYYTSGHNQSRQAWMQPLDRPLNGSIGAPWTMDNADGSESRFIKLTGAGAPVYAEDEFGSRSYVYDGVSEVRLLSPTSGLIYVYKQFNYDFYMAKNPSGSLPAGVSAFACQGSSGATHATMQCGIQSVNLWLLSEIREYQSDYIVTRLERNSSGRVAGIYNRANQLIENYIYANVQSKPILPTRVQILANLLGSSFPEFVMEWDGNQLKKVEARNVERAGDVETTYNYSSAYILQNITSTADDGFTTTTNLTFAPTGGSPHPLGTLLSMTQGTLKKEFTYLTNSGQTLWEATVDTWLKASGPKTSRELFTMAKYSGECLRVEETDRYNQVVFITRETAKPAFIKKILGPFKAGVQRGYEVVRRGSGDEVNKWDVTTLKLLSVPTGGGSGTSWNLWTATVNANSGLVEAHNPYGQTANRTTFEYVTHDRQNLQAVYQPTKTIRYKSNAVLTWTENQYFPSGNTGKLLQHIKVNGETWVTYTPTMTVTACGPTGSCRYPASLMEVSMPGTLASINRTTTFDNMGDVTAYTVPFLNGSNSFNSIHHQTGANSYDKFALVTESTKPLVTKTLAVGNSWGTRSTASYQGAGLYRTIIAPGTSDLNPNNPVTASATTATVEATINSAGNVTTYNFDGTRVWNQASGDVCITGTTC